MTYTFILMNEIFFCKWVLCFCLKLNVSNRCLKSLAYLEINTCNIYLMQKSSPQRKPTEMETTRIVNHNLYQQILTKFKAPLPLPPDLRVCMDSRSWCGLDITITVEMVMMDSAINNIHEKATVYWKIHVQNTRIPH